MFELIESICLFLTVCGGKQFDGLVIGPFGMAGASDFDG